MRYLFVGLYLFLLNVPTCTAQSWEPWDFDASAQATQSQEMDHPLKLPFDPGAMLIRVWQQGLTSQDGPTCPFYPSCSEYARIAIERYGTFWGWALGMERYMRDHRWSDEFPYPEYRGYLYDPVP